jgi:gamma-glutamylcyclotransferase (GGCT)/AIG2-like uncharacterized protein YtfP
MNDYLAVYGSLLRCEGMLARLGAEQFLGFVGPVTIPGMLYDLGEYPGLLPAQSGETVPGELFAFEDPRVLAILDEYEGFDASAPAQSPFTRGRQEVGPEVRQAWVYYYRRDVTNRPRIVGLSWPEYKSRRDSARGQA